MTTRVLPPLPRPVISTTCGPAAKIRVPAAGSHPDLSVVMVAYGTGPVIRASLAALSDAIDEAELATEVVVVSNLHPDAGHATADALALSTAGVRLVRAPGNLGFGGGNDLGIDLTRGEVTMLLNPDAIIGGPALRRLVEVARRDAEVIVAPTLVDADGALDEAGMTIDLRGRTAPVREPGAAFDFASAACWVFRRRLHERLGGFDPIFHPAYFEDADLAFRLERIGGRTIVLDDVTVIHRRGGSVLGPTDSSVQGGRFTERWRRRLGS